MRTPIISEDIRPVMARLLAYRNQREDGPMEPAETVRLFHTRELDVILNPDEAAAIASIAAGRAISPDYIKRLRLAKRLRAKKVSTRAYVFALRDVLLLEYRQPYERKPPGRPPRNTLKAVSASGEN